MALPRRERDFPAGSLPSEIHFREMGSGRGPQRGWVSLTRPSESQSSVLPLHQVQTLGLSAGYLVTPPAPLLGLAKKSFSLWEGRVAGWSRKGWT